MSNDVRTPAELRDSQRARGVEAGAFRVEQAESPAARNSHRPALGVLEDAGFGALGDSRARRAEDDKEIWRWRREHAGAEMNSSGGRCETID